MCISLAHRGPDATGFYEASGVGLAHCRLSIIDLATGQQPMPNEDGSIHVVFNGEIYNYQELTAELKRRGHIFRSTSDTEVIVHLYEDLGLGFAERLRGMFAIGLWDAKRKRLVLVRDRIGEKPLYYMQEGASILFGSEMKAILQRNAARRVKAQAVCEFLAANYVPAPRTFYEGICKLPPAHMLVWENGQAKVTAYWRRHAGSSISPPFAEAADHLTELLVEVTRLCLKSDVEVGAFLSGGIDSSVVVALMRKHEARVQTFAVGFGGQARGFNELKYARRVAQKLGTDHHELIISAGSSIELLPRILWHFDEPHGNPTSVLVYLLSHFTKQTVKVALGGTGGDEVFFGYPRHMGVRLLEYYRLLPRFVRVHFIERIVQQWPESTKGSRFAKRARRFVLGSNLPPENAYLSWVSLIHQDVRARLLTDQIRASSDDPLGDGFLRDYLMDGDSCSLLDRVADLDIAAYLPEFQLAYMDRMSMAHGLEVRSPLCDAEVVDYVASLPTSYRLKGLCTKHILKHVAQQWIPRDIVKRKKVGFDSPIGQWIKDELRQFLLAFLSPEHVQRSGMLNPSVVQELIHEHLSGRRDYSMQLWNIIALECWYRMFIEAGVTTTSQCDLKDIRGAAPAVARTSL